MNEELVVLELNQTWDIVPRPQNRKIIRSRWVYKIKHKSNGDVEKLKARLVAKGHTQMEEFEYKETSPIAKIVLVRTLLAVASTKHWITYRMDVNNVFLHANLQENIYMSPHLTCCHQQIKECASSKSLYIVSNKPIEIDTKTSPMLW